MAEILKQYNNGQVIAVATMKELKDISHIDSSMMSKLNGNKDGKHLGTVNLIENLTNTKVSFLKNIMQNSDYMYVDGRKGKFKYDVLMDAEYPIIVQNIEEGEYLGKDGTRFKIKLSIPFRQGDIISYDMDGLQLYVVDDEEIRKEGDGFIHVVELATKNPDAYFSGAHLKAGTRFYKIRGVLAEYSTSEWSGITGGGVPSKVTLEHTLGAAQGVQVSYTDYAATVGIGGGENSYVTEHLLRQSSLYGDSKTRAEDKFLIAGTKVNGQLSMKGVKTVDRLMNVLATGELTKMLASSILFGQAATITGKNGVSVINDGIYQQLRQGIRLTYRNETELRSMLRQASDIIYQGTNIRKELREMKFTVGSRAFDLVRLLFKKEFELKNVTFVDQSLIPVPILTGKDRYDLDYKSFAIGSAYLEEIGYVTLEHDASLDYDFGDVVIRGYTGGMNKRAWSLIMWDIADPKVTNLLDKNVAPEGVEIDQLAQRKNLYIVKPEGIPDISWGTETGRKSGTGVNSVGGYQGETFWCKGQMDGFVLDKGRTVLIEREDVFTEANVGNFNA
jgi:hypothetical protein